MNSEFKVAATGDSIITRPISFYVDEAFLSIIKVIREADVGFTNLEVVICDPAEGYPAAEYGGAYLIVKPYIADELKWAGFNLVSRANNHTVDWGYEGLFTTSRILDDRRIVHAGVGMNLGEARNPAYLETKKGRVALISSASSFSNFGRAGEARRDVQGRPGLNPLRFKTEIRVTRESLKQMKSIVESVRTNMAIGPVREKSIVFGRYVGGRHSYVSDRSLDGVRFVEGETPGWHTEPYEADLKGIIRSVEDARKQADLVLCTHHGHEDNGSIRYMPAKFIETYARACIDAGADAFLGHGPHVLRGIEIYKDKPIIYSMGNFFFQSVTPRKQGQDIYDRYHLGTDATISDLFDARSHSRESEWKGWKSHTLESPEWDSFIADLTFDGQDFVELKLHPTTLGFKLPSTKRGTPVKANPEDSKRIIDFIAEYSKPYRTRIEIEDGVGKVQL